MAAAANLPSNVVRTLWTNSRHTMQSLTRVTRIRLLYAVLIGRRNLKWSEDSWLSPRGRGPGARRTRPPTC